MSAANLLFVLTGSIAAYKACAAVSQLVQLGYSVRTVATPSALRFVGEATLEGLTGQPVVTDLWAPGRAMDHLNLTRWADAVVICPATANTINRLAAGLADEIVGALFLARDPAKPWLVAPAMNPAMWAHPATATSVATLRGWGVQFLSVGAGRMACGDTGEGRLAEPDAIVASVTAALARPARRLRVLITSGGTAEPLDGVRVLTNTSTGRTGAGLAAFFARSGHAVTLLRAEQSVPAGASVAPLLAEETFATFADLDAALTRLLGETEFDAVIHAAAVGDFAIEAVRVGDRLVPRGAKLASSQPLQLTLRPQPKLVNTLRTRCRADLPRLAVVAFKLTTHATDAEAQAAVQRLFAEAAPDFVVHNDLAARGAVPGDFPATIHGATLAAPSACATRAELAATLERLLTTFSPNTHAPLS